MKPFLSLYVCFLIIISIQQAGAQGCVAVRNFSCAAPMSDDSSSNRHWQFTTGYRYLMSDRHFRGKEEEEERQEENTEVINTTHSFDISLTYAFNNRWSVSATLPLAHSSRSSLYEHGFDGDGDGNPDTDGDGEPDDDPDDRYTTHAYGIGDLRLTGYYRVLDPLRHRKRNVVVGLGLKLPTGQAGATDVFYREDGPDERVVDQSIQTGDGGWGINTEIQFYTEIAKGLGLYVNGFYLFNPMDTNHVDRGRGTYGVDRYFSAPDQFLARAGLYYRIPKTGLTPNLGVRMEGVPAEDAIGKDSGYRRPGYTFSIEPGVTLAHKIHYVELNVPVALIRNRTQSYSDKVRSEETGRYIIGDAAFADYLILITYSVKFGGK